MRMRLCLTLPRHADSVVVARHSLGRVLAELGVRADCRQEIELALSEACSNAVQHAADSEPVYKVTAEVDNGECVITVDDTGSGDLPTETAMPAVTAASGRGLAIMRATMDGIHLRARPLGGLSVRLLKKLRWNPGALGALPP